MKEDGARWLYCITGIDRGNSEMISFSSSAVIQALVLHLVVA